jgi:hypothetical protein
VGHIVSLEVSLELILGDSRDIGVGIAGSLPPVSCSSKQLVSLKEPFHGRNTGLSPASSRLTSASLLHPWDPWPERRCWGGYSEICPAQTEVVVVPAAAIVAAAS